MIHHMMQEPDDLFDYDFSDEESSTKKGNDQVEVVNFHQWLSQKLKTKSEDDIPDLIDSIEKDETAYSKYDAILIDEGQDFKGDRKSTRLNSSHVSISYAVFCLKKKKSISIDNNIVEEKLV